VTSPDQTADDELSLVASRCFRRRAPQGFVVVRLQIALVQRRLSRGHDNENVANSGESVQSMTPEQPSEALEGEIVEPPREGTLAWLQTLEHVEVLGLELPRTHRVPEGASLAEPSGKCRVIRPDGHRCGAVATRLYGVCLVHAGGGGTDLVAMRQQSSLKRARLKTSRQLLGLSPGRAADPRQLLRLRAHERAEALAEAMLAPLDDEQLGTLAKQGAARTVLDSAFPIQTVSLEVELPPDPDEIEGMSWSNMRQLAAQLLGSET
jgi:hypothetical protein